MPRLQPLTAESRAPVRRAGRGGPKGATAVLGARVAIEDFELIDTAAEILGVDRTDIVASGAVTYAVRVVRQQARLLRQITDRRLRRALRRAQRGGR